MQCSGSRLPTARVSGDTACRRQRLQAACLLSIHKSNMCVSASAVIEHWRAHPPGAARSRSNAFATRALYALAAAALVAPRFGVSLPVEGGRARVRGAPCLECGEGGHRKGSHRNGEGAGGGRVRHLHCHHLGLRARHPVPPGSLTRRLGARVLALDGPRLTAPRAPQRQEEATPYRRLPPPCSEQVAAAGWPRVRRWWAP